eukprot:scaffold5075_cov72-Phaeocystis_antarctica.AAC.3
MWRTACNPMWRMPAAAARLPTGRRVRLRPPPPHAPPDRTPLRSQRVPQRARPPPRRWSARAWPPSLLGPWRAWHAPLRSAIAEARPGRGAPWRARWPRQRGLPTCG